MFRLYFQMQLIHTKGIKARTATGCQFVQITKLLNPDYIIISKFSESIL